MKNWLALASLILLQVACGDQKNSRTKNRPSEAIEEGDSYLSKTISSPGMQRGEVSIQDGSIVVEEGAVDIPYSVRISRQITDDVAEFSLNFQVLTQGTNSILPTANLTGRIQVTQLVSGGDAKEIYVSISTLDENGNTVVQSVSKNDIFVQKVSDDPVSYQVSILLRTTSAVLTFRRVPFPTALPISNDTDGLRLQNIEIADSAIRIQGRNLNLISGMRVADSDASISVTSSDANQMSATFVGNLKIALRKVDQLIFSTAYGDTVATNSVEIKTTGDYSFSGNVSVIGADSNAVVGKNTKAVLKVVNTDASSFNRNAEIQMFIFDPTLAKNAIAGISGIYKNWHAVNGTGGDLAFLTKDSAIGDIPTEKMRITDVGRVGIGTTAPVAKMQIVGTADDTNGILNVRNATSATNGTANAGIITSNVNNSVQVMAWENLGARIGTRSSATGAGDVFFTTDDTVRMTILDTGNVGIGTTIPTYSLDVAGDINSTPGCFRQNGNPLAGSCTSDVRLKRDIHPIENAANKIASLNPVHYEFRADEFPDRHMSRTPQTGLIAQEVEKTLPGLVSEDDDGFKRVNYGMELQMTMVAAIKELKLQHDQHEKEMRSEIARLKKIICEKQLDADVCR